MDGEESKLGGANKKHRRFEECLFTNLLSVERSTACAFFLRT